MLVYKSEKYQNREEAEHCILPEIYSAVDEDSFRSRREVITVKLHEGVEYIGDYAFKLCYNLRELKLPERVDFFGAGVFQQCNKLKSIRLPEGTRRIDSGMFVCCESLTRLEIPGTVEEIDPYAFQTCRELRDVKAAPEVFKLLPVSVKRIAALTHFNECSGPVDELMGSFARDNAYDIAKGAIESNRYQAIEFMISNDMIMKSDVPKLLDDAGRLGKTEFSAMLIGAGQKSETADELFGWNPFA